jgi:phosphoserine phosphatase
LHVYAAATLKQVSLTDLRMKYRSAIELMSYLWSPGAIKLLRDLPASMTVVLVTGSEQLQTEECVRQLGRYGIRTDRIIVRGSLYGVDEQSRFDGSCHKLNITMEAKREAVAELSEQHAVRMAVGNSRSVSALIEAVDFGGIRCFVSNKRRQKAPIALKRKLRKAFAELGDIHVDDERLERLLALQRQSNAESVLV